MMRFIEILRGRNVAKKGQTSLEDMKFANKVKVMTLNLLSAVLSDKDAVEIELPKNAVPCFLDLLDDPAFEVYQYTQVSEDKYIFRNRSVRI